MTEEALLPRLLVFSDVPVEASYHGSALMYRLLENYPRNRLAIIEAGLEGSKPERRIVGVRYLYAPLPLKRFSRTRLAGIFQSVALYSAEMRSLLFRKLIRKLAPDAVLTVTHGSSWITAAALARRVGVPLHLVCHDEWAYMAGVQDRRDRIFGKVYRQAASRLCISSFMAEDYARRYGAPGQVLHPSRSKDSPRSDRPPQRLLEGKESLTCIFAGTVNNRGTVVALRRMAGALSATGGRLVIYGPLGRDAAMANGLEAGNIELRGLVSPAELFNRLRTEGDLLYVPMSFADVDRSNMQIAFPSKLTDYTAVGLPLLVHGPEYCSAVRWARDNPGVAEAVTTLDPTGLAQSLARLADPGHRWRLGQAALDIGEQQFSHRAVTDVFLAAIRQQTNQRGFGLAGEGSWP